MARRKALLASASAAGALLAASIGIVTLPAEAATSGCSVNYSVQSQWQGGFVGNVSLTNLGSPLPSWTLTYDFPAADQKVTNGWSANWSQSGTRVTVTSMSWNGGLGTNASTAVGFQGTFGAANPSPAVFSLNGVTCTGAIGSPSPAPSISRPSNPSTSPAGSPSASPTKSPSVSPSVSPSKPTPGAAPALKVSGNKVVTASGAPYRLLGVNRSGAEFACVQGKGVFDSAQPDQASVNAMKAWNIHAVRIPLNENCWLGTFGAPSGPAYQQAVKDYVNLLVANGMNVILDLHWTHGVYTGTGTACADVNATCQKAMPDAQYAPQFWTSVANTFKGNNAVIFDLFNEPYPDASNNWTDATAAWKCLRDGGTCAGINYPVAGMQSLVNAVRATGATNIVMIAGLTWTNDLTQWLAYKPNDPTGNLVASWHSYNFNACVTAACWDSQIGTVAAKVPVVTGEIGQDSCAHDYIDRLMAWLDKTGIGYLAWTWNPWGCSQGNVLINNFGGTPTSTYGEGFKAHLLTQNP